VDKNVYDQTNITEDPQDMYYFAALNVAVVVFTIVRTMLFYKMAMKSSTQLHNSMYQGITRAAMYFFNTNPSGRILNRFSKDLGQLDEVLPTVMLDVVQIFLTLLGIIIVICITNPYYLILTLALAIIFYYIREFYLKTSRDVKRLEAVARSPIYSHLSATITGLPTIRALGAQKELIAEFDNLQDLHSSGYYTFLATNRGLWLLPGLLLHFVHCDNHPQLLYKPTGKLWRSGFGHHPGDGHDGNGAVGNAPVGGAGEHDDRRGASGGVR